MLAVPQPLEFQLYGEGDPTNACGEAMIFLPVQQHSVTED